MCNSYFCVTPSPLPPTPNKKNQALHEPRPRFLNNSKSTNHTHISVTRSAHRNAKLSKNTKFLKVHWCRFEISQYICVHIKKKKQNPENFAFLILGILELFVREGCKFLKKVGSFLTHSIVSECLSTNISHILRADIWKSKTFNISFSYEDEDVSRLSICISVPLIFQKIC